MDTSKLFDHPITRSSQISLADQIRDILCEEIHAGRWEIDEKLPSMMTIANHCGVSRMPVQQAIERLGEEGYVRGENRSGVFLSSMMPEGRIPLGTIGIALLSDPQNEKEMEFLAYEQLLLHRFIKKAEQQNYQTKVVYIAANQDWGELNQEDGIFGDEVKGIISLVPFPREAEGELAEDRIPLVFWCEPDHRCAPCITSDYEAAFYRLTVRAIREGGKSRIAILPCPILTPYVHDCFLRGYRKAVADCSVESLKIDRGGDIGLRDTSGILKLLEEIPVDTTIACMSLHRAEQVVGALAAAGRRVPEDIGVVGTNPPDEGMSNGQKLTGVGFSWDREIDMVIKLLREQMIHRRWNTSTLMITPYIANGDTLPLRPACRRLDCAGNQP
ncbi:MAG: GntR family transcriptional regulator [Verrucomicrobiota bacterium]